MSQFRVYSLLIVPVIINYIVLHVSADYDFSVIPVEKCPMNKEDWDMASARLKCNSTHGYHCVPNKQITSLIEFCYPKGYRFPFEAGNCLKLASNGILNQVPCANTFDDGCPKSHYFSDKIYNYPKCLGINKRLKCFEADHECIYLGVLKNKEFEDNVTTSETSVKDTSNQCSNITTESSSTAVVVALAILLGISVSVLLITCVFIYCKGLVRCKQLKYDTVLLHDRLDFGGDSYNPRTSKTNTQYKEQSVQTEPLNYDNYDDDYAFEEDLLVGVNREENDTGKETIRKLHDIIEHGEEQQFEILRSQYSKDKYEKLNSRGFNSLHLSAKCDIVLPPQHISQPLNPADQLRTSIVAGDFRTFQYLIHKFDKHSLEEVDSNGFNCLHSAAKGGNLSIFKKICNVGVSVEKKTNDGSNILHIAAHHGCYPICKYILDNHAALFSLKDNLGMNPAHSAANAGQYHILDLMLKQGCDLFAGDEKNNENIVHLACMVGSLEVCQFVKANKNLEKLLHAKNSGDWNSIQYATKNGHLDIVKFLLENGVDVKNKSKKIGKNCLHTASEFGKHKICEYIISKAPNLITYTDSYGQHAGHYAAKNGHTDILQLLINTDKYAMQRPSHDKINILHVACENAHYDMVVKIAKVFPCMVKEITENGWNAALFITNKADAEEERIKILKHLLLHGLDVYNVSKSGKTVLLNAQKNNLKDIEHYLCEQFPKLIGSKRSISY